MVIHWYHLLPEAFSDLFHVSHQVISFPVAPFQEANRQAWWWASLPEASSPEWGTVPNLPAVQRLWIPVTAPSYTWIQQRHRSFIISILQTSSNEQDQTSWQILTKPNCVQSWLWEQIPETRHLKQVFHIIHIQTVERSQEAGGVRRKICVWDITSLSAFTSHTHTLNKSIPTQRSAMNISSCHVFALCPRGSDWQMFSNRFHIRLPDQQTLTHLWSSTQATTSRINSSWTACPQS